MSQQRLTESPEKTQHRIEHRESSPASARSFHRELHPLLQLQRTIGNRAVRRLIQAKLAVRHPGEPYEREADRVAEQVTNMPSPASTPTARRQMRPENDKDTHPLQTKPLGASIMPLAQRQAMPEEEKKEEKPGQPQSLLQRSVGEESVDTGHSIEQQLGQSSDIGSPLPASVRSYMASRFRADFSDVRVHTGSESQPLHRSLNAQAFTVGQDIDYGASQSLTDVSLTAHEPTHVMQQRAGRASGPTGKGGDLLVDPVLEREADEIGERVEISGGSAVASASVVQGKDASEEAVSEEAVSEEAVSEEAEAVVAPSMAGPPLQKITIEPANPLLTGPAHFGQSAKQQQFKAMGFFADKSKLDLTAKAEWSSSVPDVVSIDQKGMATAGYKSGTATIAATDRTSAAQGAAIGGSTKVTVTIPDLKSIAIKPTDTKIAGGEERQFTATRVYSDGSTVDLGGGKRFITWSSSSDSIYINDDGLARTGGVGTVKVTATDKAGGVSGEITITVEWQREMETPFGTFTYIANTESKVMPLLTKAVGSFTEAESLDEKLNELHLKLVESADKNRPIKEVVEDIKKHTDRPTKGEATSATNAGIAVQHLQMTLETLEHEAKQAVANFTITQDDLKGAQDLARAEALMKEAKKQQEALNTFVRVISIGIDSAFKLSKGDPSVLKPAWDATGMVIEHFANNGNPWLQEAQSLQEAAQKNALDNAAKKFALAGQNLKFMKKTLQKAVPLGQKAIAVYGEQWKTAEEHFDTSSRGSFRFGDLKEGVDQAQKTSDLAQKTTEAAYRARDAAKALARPNVAPSEWMANPTQDQRIIQAMLEGATGMFDLAIERRQEAEALLERFRDTHMAAREGMFAAPGTGTPRAQKK